MRAGTDRPSSPTGDATAAARIAQLLGVPSRTGRAPVLRRYVEGRTRFFDVAVLQAIESVMPDRDRWCRLRRPQRPLPHAGRPPARTARVLGGEAAHPALRRTASYRPSETGDGPAVGSDRRESKRGRSGASSACHGSPPRPSMSGFAGPDRTPLDRKGCCRHPARAHVLPLVGARALPTQGRRSIVQRGQAEPADPLRADDDVHLGDRAA